MRRFCSVLHGLRFWLAFLCVIAALLAQPHLAVADEERMRLAAESLANLQLPNGLLIYEVNLRDKSATGMTRVDPANMVRQTASAFFLADYLRRNRSSRLKTAIEAAIQAFGERTLPIGRGTVQSLLESSGALNFWFAQKNLSGPMDALGLLYSTEGDGGVVSPDGSYGNALLGATALALLAELHYHKATGENRFAAMRRAWLDGLLSLRVPGRGFRWAASLLRESHYFNAEGWFALATYVMMFPGDERARAVLEEVDVYLLHRYSTKHSHMFFHWGTMAAEVRYATTGEDRFLEFIADQASHFLDKKELEPTGDSAGSCAAVEGLATAQRVLARSGKEPELQVRLRARIAAEMDVSLSLQILPGQDRIALDNGAILLSPDFSDYVGGFLVGRADPLLRIDITGHCLSAMVRMSENGLEG